MWHLVYRYLDGSAALLGVYATERIAKLFMQERVKRGFFSRGLGVERAGTTFVVRS